MVYGLEDCLIVEDRAEEKMNETSCSTFLEIFCSIYY
jgi:hypothetical protein